MKTYDEVFELVKNIMLKIFRLKEDQIVPNANLKNELNLDSLDGIDILCELEYLYGTELISSEDKKNKDKFYKAMKGTVNDLVICLMEIINNKEN